MTSMSQPAPQAHVNHITRSFTELASTVRDTGLLARSHVFYAVYGLALVLALAGVITGMILLGDSWFQLLMAALLGIVFTQIAFMGHEASHRAIFASGPANDRLGRLLSTVLVGISHSWWMNKHSRHHANPNQMGKDPDIASDTIMFVESDAAQSTGLVRAIVKRQGWLFFPLLTLEGLNLHYRAFASLIEQGTRRQKWI
jgi:fatty acid desaturase